GLDGGVDTEGLVFANEVGDGGRDDHELVGGDHAIGVDARAQRLREHGQESGGQLHADLFLLVGGEGVDDAVDGAGGTGGVQGAKDQVAGFGGADGGGDGFQVAHFADEDHVGILPEGASQSLGKRGGIAADF